MRQYFKFYVDGRWVDPCEPRTLDVVNPATERVCGQISVGGAKDVDRAVAAARAAFSRWSRSQREERVALLEAIAAEYVKRSDDLADAVIEEMGAPASLARSTHVPLGLLHLRTAIEVLETFSFETREAGTLVVREPIGVCGLVTPWNWPLNQIAAKVAPALATGCTMVLKPSEIAPLSGQIFAEVLDSAGVPAGVFNLVQGDGAGVGTALSCHADIDMISFTGSTRAGVEIARNAAPTVKRVMQELGGKSANIVVDDGEFSANVRRGVLAMMSNTGQTCAAPSRMLVPLDRLDEAVSIAREIAATVTVGDPRTDAVMGPLASKAQFEKVVRLISTGIEEGATLVCGGLARPAGLDRGYYVLPTVFANVNNRMTIAREEIFGPVLCVMTYRDVAEAVDIANDTDYGLAAFISAADRNAAEHIAKDLRAGLVCINHGYDPHAPFGGYKKSGNGREGGRFGFDEYLELKAIVTA